jgi:ankyrin repeat protein
MVRRILGCVFWGTVLVTVVQTRCAAEAGVDLAPQTPPRRIDFRKDVAPILQQSCVECHGGTLKLAGLRLDERHFALEGGDSGSPITPGRGEESLLVQRLVDKDLGIIMPPSFPFLPGEKPGLRAEQIAVLKLWIDQGAEWPEGVSLAPSSSSAPEDQRATALFAAIRAGNRPAVAAMLDDAALVGVTDPRGSTPLLHAALLADAAMVRLLIEHGADVNAANHDGITALMWAAGDADKVRLLLDNGAKVNARSGLGRTPLLVAATYAGNAQVVRLLIKNGANVTDQDTFQETALTSASKRGDVELVEMLIEAGADVQAGGRWPLDWATEEGNAETVACLLKHGASDNRDRLNAALVTATMRGPTEAVRLLLEYGADPNASPTIGVFGSFTPLMGAAYSASNGTDAVKLLLQKGADVRAKTSSGETALTFARKSGHAQVIELLEKAGATE